MMIDVPFVKAHGLGNDYLIVESAVVPEGAVDLARAMCDRTTGIGGDGLILLSSGDTAGARFRIFNADGSEAELCGNGLRCAAVFLTGCSEGSTTVESAVGHHGADVTRGPRGEWQVAMDLVAAQVEQDVSMVVDDANYTLRVVRVGNPHAVLLVEAPPAEGLLGQLAAACEGHERFVDGVNVHIAWPRGNAGLSMVSWERGVGPVQACATGAAAAVAAIGTAHRCDVGMPGGSLAIEAPAGDTAIRMCGPAVIICEGVYHYIGEQP